MTTDFERRTRPTSLPIPVQSIEPRPWSFRKTLRGVREYPAAVPISLMELEISVPPEMDERLRDTALMIAAAEASAPVSLSALEPFLVRTEAIASSRIEDERTTVDQLARAEAGVRVSAKTRTVYAAALALQKLVNASGQEITLDSILAAHKSLMEGDAAEQFHAGRLRDMQNWIGGLGAHPVGADYVPPHPSRVADGIEDLIAFAAARGIDPIVQAALVHAQFEAIHPFTDGNGRIGRALINTVLRARGVTKTLLVPVAAALAADQTRYFASLEQFHLGDAGPIVGVVVDSLRLSTSEMARSSELLAELPEIWREAAKPRRGSAAARLIDRLLTEPVVDPDEIQARLQISEATAYRTIGALEEAGVLRRLGQSRRDSLWGASAVLDEADNLLERVQEEVALGRWV